MQLLQYVFVIIYIQCVLLNDTESAALSDINITRSMASVDYSTVEIKEKPLFTPSLDDIVEVLSRSLPSTFEYVSVTAEETPDLTQSPYNLMAPGLSGAAQLVELGGPPYLLPRVRRDKLYDLAALLRHVRRDPALLVGAGAGPWPRLGHNCEGIINLRVEGGVVRQGTRVVSVQGEGYRQERLPDDETRTALLGNYLLSEGKPGKVIKVVAKKRIGENNFITAIREALKNHYGDKVVGLGGAFVLRAGSVKHHVMPDFSPHALASDEDVERWLHFYTMRAPITHVGTLVTGDLGLDLRVQHFHGFSEHGDGGHYHYDTTPEVVHYEGYFAVAQSVLRVDAPLDTHGFGRD